MSTFSNWQPIYAAHRIATFPVRMVGVDGKVEKKPAIRNYLRIGLRGSTELAKSERFEDASALGFAPGARSGVTILDVDTTDETVLADALDRHGRTAVVARTASGRFHAWYKHKGERRQIRPWSDRPIDILGGGFVVAPPSTANGAEYQFIEGTLDDLDALPVLRGLDFPVAPVAAAHVSMEGHRNNDLFRHCLRQARVCADFDALLDVARTFNGHCLPPLPDGEVVKTARSAWGKQATGINWTGEHMVVFKGRAADRMIREDPDCFILLSFLRANNGPHSEFMATTKGLAQILGWRLTRLSAARRRLLDQGEVIQTRLARSKQPALYRWGRPFNETGKTGLGYPK